MVNIYIERLFHLVTSVGQRSHADPPLRKRTSDLLNPCSDALSLSHRELGFHSVAYATRSLVRCTTELQSLCRERSLRRSDMISSIPFLICFIVFLGRKCATNGPNSDTYNAKEFTWCLFLNRREITLRIATLRMLFLAFTHLLTRANRTTKGISKPKQKDHYELIWHLLNLLCCKEAIVMLVP